MIKLQLFLDNRGILDIESDGNGEYTVTGDSLRGIGKGEYKTKDGLHVSGVIQQHFGTLDSREFLLAAIKEAENAS